MKLLGIIVVGVLLLLVGPAVPNATAGDVCWQLDSFPTDFIRADIKLLDFDPKKLVAAFWRLIVCPGCTNQHADRVYMAGTFQPDLDPGSKVMTLTGSIQDDSLGSPQVFQCFLHLLFPNATLQTGEVSGGCPLYFGTFQDTLTKVSCNTVPNP